jgi:hypothetical protein
MPTDKNANKHEGQYIIRKNVFITMSPLHITTKVFSVELIHKVRIEENYTD